MAQIQNVGFREQDGKIIGHAWVLVDDVSIVEPESDLLRFSPVLRFGARAHFFHRREQAASRGPWLAKSRSAIPASDRPSIGRQA